MVAESGRGRDSCLAHSCAWPTPLFVFAVNVTLLAHHYQWELGRLSPFLLVGKWVGAPVTNDGVAASLTAPASRPQHSIPRFPKRILPWRCPPSHTRRERQSSKELFQSSFRYRGNILREMARTLGVVFLVLTVIGFVRGRRELLDPRKAVLGLLTLAVLLAIWVRVSEIGNLNGRYFLLLVFLDAPFTAIGGLVVIRQLERLVLQWDLVWLTTRRVAPSF